MRKLASNQNELNVIDKLNGIIINKPDIQPSKVWAYLSVPKKVHEFTQGRGGNKKSYRQDFSDDEVSALESLKEKLKDNLVKKSRYRCSYCKRTIGRHGWSWEIEHIKNKKDYRNLTFSLDNLVAACIDCNRYKNINVDSKQLSHKIVNPNDSSFKYDDHMRYLQFSTERLHYLKYITVSDSGRFLYDKLCLSSFERQEILKSIDERKCDLINKIDSAIQHFSIDSEHEKLAMFLQRVKKRLINPE